jgi:hypothetical protein
MFFRKEKRKTELYHKANWCIRAAINCWHENKQEMGDFWHRYAVELNEKAAQL